MNWLLIIVLAIIVVNAFVGRKVGFIKTVFSLCSMIVALILTVWISPTVNDLMKSNDKIHGYITEKVEVIVQSEFEDGEEEAQDTIIENLPLPQSIKDSLIENQDSQIYGVLTAGSLKEYIVNYLVNIIINALAFIATFVLILIILWILCFALNLISKLPILNSINKTAGLLAGLVHGLVIVWIFFILITVFGSTEIGQQALKMIGESEILSLIYNNNLLLSFVTGAIKMIF